MAISPYIASLRQKIGSDLLLLPAVGAVIVDETGRVLLHRASDDGRWYMIGGAVDPGEEPADAVVREVREEVGIEVEPVRITGVYASPLVTYPNGHQVRYVGTIFLCRPVPGAAAPRVADDESLEVRWFHPHELPELRPDQRLKIEQALRGDATSPLPSNNVLTVPVPRPVLPGRALCDGTRHASPAVAQRASRRPRPATFGRIS
jgi:8-oxo-dGTP diphosphatase